MVTPTVSSSMDTLTFALVADPSEGAPHLCLDRFGCVLGGTGTGYATGRLGRRIGDDGRRVQAEDHVDREQQERQERGDAGKRRHDAGPVFPAEP